jgi:hypothetical protein
VQICPPANPGWVETSPPTSIVRRHNQMEKLGLKAKEILAAVVFLALKSMLCVAT